MYKFCKIINSRISIKHNNYYNKRGERLYTMSELPSKNRNTYFYIISNDVYSSKNMYKVGFHTGSIKDLEKRYKTYLITPIVEFIIRASRKDEKNLLTILKHKIVENSEWVNMDIDTLRIIALQYFNKSTIPPSHSSNTGILTSLSNTLSKLWSYNNTNNIKNDDLDKVHNGNDEINKKTNTKTDNKNNNANDEINKKTNNTKIDKNNNNETKKKTKNGTKDNEIDKYLDDNILEKFNNMKITGGRRGEREMTKLELLTLINDIGLTSKDDMTIKELKGMVIEYVNTKSKKYKNKLFLDTR
ncbi:T5orf172 domain-containing protein [Orpheovirus IHUMI-LCC2]|uniref:T5orf172 domain-containing protein n=1 Tax=Orpheovirus IHUMI-LCC2 TaxID=2023057 RepID=A0A2I2L379_9VIRU|nr:T5orf172 domain-containing protein [Orpheovirus IHUMI-LCC2]SNW61984.1 T5orf172 domain-containing protein [Orpheovirus IHUMI-LCC2]